MKFEIKKKANCKDSIVRTIRFDGNVYDKIVQLAEDNNVTFNNIVNQILEYFLNNLK